MVIVCCGDVSRSCWISISGLRSTKTSPNLKATGLFEVVTDMIMKRTTSWMQQTQLSSSKCQLSALLTAITRVVVWIMYAGLAR